jgi:uncharacterized membrane protein YcaP (DUF421 family)
VWANLFHLDLPAGNLIVRAVLVYLSVVVLLRVSGKRQIGQMGATEFVAILLISNAVQNSMNGGDNSLAGGLILATILILLSAVISYLTYRSKFFTSVFEGTPTIIIHKGKVLRRNMIKERMNESDLRTLLRKQGIHDVTDINSAILESDGTLSVSHYKEQPFDLA